MGLIYQIAKGHIKDYAEGTKLFDYSLVNVGKPDVSVKLSPLTRKEVETLLHDLDAMANDAQYPEIARAVAAEVPAIIDAVRMVNAETKQGYGGMRAVGGELDVGWLIPEMIGNTTLLNNAATATKGIYTTANGTRTWTKTFTAGTSASIIPSQQMVQYAACVHIGAIDTIDIPKANRIRFTLSGVNTGLQPLNFSHREKRSDSDTAFTKFKQSIIAGPLKTQAVDIFPYLTGDSKIELLTVLIAIAESLTL